MKSKITKKVSRRLLLILPVILSVSLLSSCGDAEALDTEEKLVISVPVEVAPLSISKSLQNTRLRLY
jgi:membrane fusion protein (multidrug efflux system)